MPLDAPWRETYGRPVSMRRTTVVIALIAAVLLAAPAVASHLGAPGFVDDGGAEGGDALYLPRGDILNVRNIQGGFDTGTHRDLNLDIGAGSSEKRGDVVLNWDVGRRVLIYDGRKRLVAKFSRRAIVFYRKVVVKRDGRR